MIKKLLIAAGGLAVALVVACAFGWHWLAGQGTQVLQLPESGADFELKRGTSLYRLAAELEAQGWIESADRFRLWLRFFAPDTPVQAGYYHLPAGLTQAGLMQQLSRGAVQSFELRWVEGATVKQLLAALAAAPHIEKTLPLDEPRAVARALGIAETSLEGLLFPAVYSYHRGTRDLDLLRQAESKLRQVLEEEWQQRQSGLPYKTPYEALIMASIIEKETGLAEERAEIAGVFVRRLQKGMRLQTDPTVIYGLGERYQGNLRRGHLREPTPYNTYVIPALPPTPIAAVGREAIHAALHPAEGKSLYFVARGDGSHQFSRTLAEHNRAVRQYQLQRRDDYRSTPDTAR